MDFQTADLCDANEAGLRTGAIQIAEPVFRHFGGRRSFGGPVATLKVFEDNSLVRTTLERPGNGRVLVVDGGGSRRCALVGDQLAQLAVRNAWAGIVVWGCVRDTRVIAGLDLGVLALAAHPQKSVKRGIGEEDVFLHFADVRVAPGAWIYADEDGLLFSDRALV